MWITKKILTAFRQVSVGSMFIHGAVMCQKRLPASGGDAPLAQVVGEEMGLWLTHDFSRG